MKHDSPRPLSPRARQRGRPRKRRRGAAPLSRRGWTALTVAVAAASLFLGRGALLPARPGAELPDSPARASQRPATLAELQSRALAELTALDPLLASDTADRLLRFRPHRADRSRLDARLDPTRASAAALTPQTCWLLARLDRAGDADATPWLQDVPRERAWRALEVLQDQSQFGASSALARRLFAAEPPGATRDLLCLIAARDGWLARADASPVAKDFMIRALNCETPAVAGEATLWRRALSAPDTPAAMELCARAWETVRLDLGHREKSAALAQRMVECAELALNALEAAGYEPARYETEMAQLLSNVSEAAFYRGRTGLLDECARRARPLLAARPSETLLSIDYFRAYHRFARGDYAGAGVLFEEIFFSGVPCDVSADAGFLLSECFAHLGNDTGALVAVDLVLDLYPDRQWIAAKAAVRRNFLRRAGAVNPARADAFLEADYGERLTLLRQRLAQDAADLTSESAAPPARGIEGLRP